METFEKAQSRCNTFNENPLTSLNTPTKLFEYMACGCNIVSASLKPILRYDIKGVNFLNQEM